MKQFIILIILVLLFYSFSWASDVPYKNTAYSIYKLLYNVHTCNCLIKSNLFCEFLKSKGIEAKVIIGRFKNEKFYRHAWIEYFYNKEWRIIDLTDKPSTWGYENKNYWWLKK